MDVRSRRIPSTALDDAASIRSRNYHGIAHHLRPVESRYSLREQFAATRREYEFGFDDASSILERSIYPSDELGDTVVVGAEPAAPEHGFLDKGPVSRNCYELLCLPNEPSLSPDQVRKAAHRLVQVLAVEKQPLRLQGPAAFHLGLAQAAFETLVEPSRRLGYDLSDLGETDLDCDGDIPDDDDTALDPEGSSTTYESSIHEQYLLLTQREARASTDIGLRVDASSLLASQRGARRHRSGLEVVDFSIRQSATASVPALRKPIESTALFLRGWFGKGGQPLRITDPTVTATMGTHGLLDEPFKLAPLFLDRYQPPGPAIHGPRRTEQLLSSRFLPVANLNLRQEIFWEPQRTQSESPRVFPRSLPGLVIEHELELLPRLSTSLRLGYSTNPPGLREPVNVEIFARKPIKPRTNVSPDLGFAIHSNVGPGTAFVLADGGDWDLRSSKECRELSKFSKVSGAFAHVMDMFRNPPTVEAGYAFGRHDLGIQSQQALTKPADRGLAAIDCDMDKNKASSWTLSTGWTPGNVAAYLRYGRDLFSFTSMTATRRKAGLRAEVELAGTAQRDFFLAFRALRRVGRFSKAGLEVGISPSNLHLSFYWSRLGQRISLPLLFSTKPRLGSSKLLFWTTVFPFAALAAWELYRQRRLVAKVVAAKSNNTAMHRDRKIQDYVARRRAEADELTAILATGVEPRQNVERNRGGLVIVSAKYGVRDAPPEESRLLGFWDPAPMSTKVLRVRYLWQGKELAVEVCGREELRLP
ncbi:hypothetical protein N656DRAFT_713814 [Canariomyces notabilis]|uniref:DnaJ-like protein C11 C-terminal domain-containing protein n=1 Tax=Canariomyces notabilis TaxID=2074819 RepID=A0AAN6QIV6_9PEZI|nr:hypothetical protein N656DRAFT_713814 [Canariomyces arenarius]